MLAIPVICQHAAGRCRQKHAKVTKPWCRKTLRFDWFNVDIPKHWGHPHHCWYFPFYKTMKWRIFGFPNDWKLFLVGQSKDAHGLCFILKHYQHYQRTYFHTNCYLYIYYIDIYIYWYIYIYWSDISCEISHGVLSCQRTWDLVGMYSKPSERQSNGAEPQLEVTGLRRDQLMIAQWDNHCGIIVDNFNGWLCLP